MRASSPSHPLQPTPPPPPTPTPSSSMPAAAPAPRWRRGSVIGHGSTATVFFATIPSTGEVRAVKSAELARAEPLRHEQCVLSQLRSPHVVGCLGFEDPVADGGDGLMYDLFLEYAAGGSVANEIKLRGGSKLDEDFIRCCTRDVLAGLAYVHSEGIVHCDIKGRNVLIGSDGRAKIADFGCARRISDPDAGKGALRGTPMFMAPEAARGEAQGPAADVWSLGCTVIEMATGAAPWPAFADAIVALNHIAYSGEVPPIPDEFTEDGKDFLSKCLVRTPTERWTAAQLLEHPFVATAAADGVKSGAIGLRHSPKTTLDQRLWDSTSSSVDVADTAAAPTPSGRLGDWAGAPPEWTWSGSWVTVRRGWNPAAVVAGEGRGDRPGQSSDAVSNGDQTRSRKRRRLDSLDDSN